MHQVKQRKVLLIIPLLLLILFAARVDVFAQTFSTQSSASFPTPLASSRVIVADFDNDYDADILYQTGANGTPFSFGRSNGNGTFTIQALSASPFAGLTLPDHTGTNYHVADFDKDGDLDLWAAVNGTTGSYFRNDNGSFSSQSSATFPAPLAAGRVVAGDFDKDGDDDLLYQTGANGTAFQFARCNGNGTFTIQTQAASPFAGLTLIDNTTNNYHVADFDGDADVDVWAGVNNATGSYFRNDNGTFTAQSSASFPAPLGAARATASDFDTDGDADILYQTGANGTAFQYARSNGDGTFTILTLAASPFASVTLADHNGSNYQVADFDKDGDQDVWAAVNSTTGGFYSKDGATPLLVSFTPANNATSIATNVNITYTFSESVTKGTGNIYITRVSDNTVVETIPVTSAQVTGSGTSWIIDPSITLAQSTQYAITSDAGTWKNISGLIFAGVTYTSTQRFTTNTIVSSVSVPANGTYKTGDNLNFTVNFSGAVIVNTGGGTPSIPITVGAVVKNATYISGSGTNALVFRYTVASGDVDNNGIAIGSAIALNGGTMKDAATADVLLTLNSIGNTTGVLVEAVPPTVSSINRQTPGTSLTNASTLVYRVTFSESVTGVDITDFALTGTGTAAGTIASVSSSSGTTIDVTVNTVTGDGTLRLDMNASGTGISDVPGNPLSGGFTTGQTYTLDHTSPAITSNGGGSTANISIAENATAVTTVTATDANPITYSIAGGADQAKFSMNVSGALTFSAAPDFESPADADANNTYIIIVRASDGFNNKDQTITVTVTNVNDNPPAITSNGGGNNATVSVPELTTAVTKVTATDADAGTTIIYSISGGADAGKFDINSSTGDLTFKTAPVYLVPTDADANNSYLVTVRASDGTFNDDQAITVNVTSSTPLPIMLTELSGSQNGSGIELIWKTTSEINIERFEVEKSNNGNGFIKVADVKASGSGANSTSYGWLDKNYYAGNNFYRLKMVDRNGDWKYSSVVRINLSAKGAFIKVTPNPIKNKTLGLQLNNISQGRYELVLYNATGQKVFNKVIDHTGGISAQTIQLPSHVSSGMYKIKLINSKESFSASLIIE